MNEDIKSLYYDNLFGRISYDVAKEKVSIICISNCLENEFNQLFIEQPENVTEIIGILLIIPSWYDLQRSFLIYYHRLLIEPWHEAHEWLIDIIMEFKSTESIEYIKTAIKLDFDYLHLNDTEYASFIRKCMWALADINNPESIELLHKYLNDDNEVIRKYADEQIRWLNGEKGMRYMS